MILKTKTKLAIVDGDWSYVFEAIKKINFNLPLSEVELLIFERMYIEFIQAEELQSALSCLRCDIYNRLIIDPKKRIEQLSVCKILVYIYIYI